MAQTTSAKSADLLNGDDFTVAEDTVILDERIHRKMITMKTIEANPERAKIAKQRVLLCWIRGIVNGTVTSEKPDQSVQFVGLAGEFTAEVYGDDGVITTYYGGILYLPTGFHESALSRLSRLSENEMVAHGGMRLSLEFAAEPAPHAAGYSYVARNMLRVPQAVDALSKLADEARLVRELRRQQALPALPVN